MESLINQTKRQTMSLSSLLPITLLFVCYLIPFGSALVCYQCSNVSGLLPHRDCSNPINQTCDVGYNTCLIALYNLTNNIGSTPLIQMLRNCSTAQDCNDNCNKRNETTNGEVLNCNIHCCSSNECNLDFPVPSTSIPSTAPSNQTTNTSSTESSNRPRVTTDTKPKITSTASTIKMVGSIAIGAAVLLGRFTGMFMA
ncbi:uncharacterized protein LOC110235263 [Exaiptasia diaphana]|uniref:Uncharacterized protein n=1 Tax=Exaiptasia diaphana TaxID=2652724 RepID=A0A913WZM5_EXADI|nr:uncharacterized protein LOC110235263 [Exaiptasia diaphana]